MDGEYGIGSAPSPLNHSGRQRPVRRAPVPFLLPAPHPPPDQAALDQSAHRRVGGKQDHGNRPEAGGTDGGRQPLRPSGLPGGESGLLRPAGALSSAGAEGPGAGFLILPAQLELEGKEELAAGENAGTVLRPRPGGGPGEDYDLREYRVGDPLRSVHWKLSSKKDELVVRETLEPQQAAIVVTYDHFGPSEELDRAFAQLWALSRWLLQQDRPHHIQWASPVTGVAEDRAVDSPNALLACLELAFSTPAPLEGRSILDGALRLPGGGKVRHLHVTPDGVEGGGR